MKVRNRTNLRTHDIERLITFASSGINTDHVTTTVIDKKDVPNLKGFGRAKKIVGMPPIDFHYEIEIHLPDQPYPIDNQIRTVKWLPFDITEAQADTLMRLDLSGVDVTWRWRQPKSEQSMVQQFGIVRQHGYGGLRSPMIIVRNWREFLVWVAAHETRHIHQMRRGKRLSEIDCEKFAAKKLGAYEWFCRTHKGVIIP